MKVFDCELSFSLHHDFILFPSNPDDDFDRYKLISRNGASLLASFHLNDFSQRKNLIKSIRQNSFPTGHLANLSANAELDYIQT